MAWNITFEKEDGEKVVVDLDDLSPDIYDEIAKDDPTGNWWSVYSFPGESFDRMYKVICAAAAKAGVEPPGRAETMRDSEALVEMLSRAPDISKQPAMNGLPQVPSETEAGSSSTSLGPPTAGPSVSPEESLSETS